MFETAIKTLALIKRKPTIDRAAFRAHYENRHVPLALPLLEGLVRYVRYHVLDSERDDLPFDVLTAFWYRDKAATDAVFAKLAGETGKAILADELEFMDKDANRFFAVSERLWVDGPEFDETKSTEDAVNEHRFVLVARPEGMSRYDSASFLAISHWPRLFAKLEEPYFALLRDGFAMSEGELPWDCVLQIRAKGYAALDPWVRSIEAEGFHVLCVRTSSCETSLR